MADTTTEEVKKVDALAAAADANAASTPTAQATPKVTNQVNSINAMYDAQKQNQLNQLETAYNINKSNAEAERAKIGQTYQGQANDLAAQYERNRRNFNNQASMNGLNTGTASQAALAQNSAWQRDYGNLRTAEAQAEETAGRNLLNMEQQYRSDVASAIANNDYSRAAALLDEYNNQYTRDIDQAKILAQYGNFDGYKNIYAAQYGDEAAAEMAKNMQNLWYSQNAKLAKQMGLITADQYDNLKNNRAINSGLDENGKRKKTASAGGGSGGGDPWGYGGAGWNPGYQLTVGNMATSEWLARNT